MKAAKLLLGVVGGIIVLLVLVIVIVFISIDKIAKAGVEKGTTYALAVPTSLNSADVGVLSGKFAMSGLEIANPEGYDSPYFLRLESAGVEVSLDSLMSDVVTLPNLSLTDLNVHIDGVTGKSNVKTILDNLKRFESDEPKPDADESAPAKQFVVNEIDIQNVVVHVHLLPLGGDISTQKLIVPEIKLTDVGSAGEPVTLAELSNIITQAILKSAEEFGGGIIPDEIMGELASGLGDLNDFAENGVEMVTSSVDEIITDTTEKLGEEIDKQVDDLKDQAGDAISEGLDSLLGGGKDEKKEDNSDGEGGGG
ncbi:MAG: AsmA family protein [Phycisphaera sp.]|nr:MAG: AsmA family protein [Phycisphaera sp.]